MSKTIKIERRGDVAYVMLSRPAKRNAMNFVMMRELVDAAQTLGDDRSLRAIVLHGEGASFCSGLDFPEVTKQPAGIARAFVAGPRGTNLFQEVCWAWRRVSVPVLAVMHGHCFGAGVQLAVAADFRFATPDCQISILEAKWGLIPDMSGSASLRELLSIDQAKRLTMTGKIIDGAEAKEINLVTALAEDPMAAAEELIAELLTRSPDSVAATKALFHKTWHVEESKAFRTERRLQTLVLMGKNQRAALKAAFAKTAAKFGPRSRAL